MKNRLFRRKNVPAKPDNGQKIYEKLEQEYQTSKHEIANMDADGQIAVIYLSYSLDAVDWCAQFLDIKLDFSLESISLVDMVLERFHQDIELNHPDEDQILQMSKQFAGYVGQTLVLGVGARWKVGESCTVKDIGPAVEIAGNEFYVLNKVYKRIINGAEDSLLAAIQVLVELRDTKHE